MRATVAPAGEGRPACLAAVFAGGAALLAPLPPGHASPAPAWLDGVADVAPVTGPLRLAADFVVLGAGGGGELRRAGGGCAARVAFPSLSAPPARLADAFGGRVTLIALDGSRVRLDLGAATLARAPLARALLAALAAALGEADVDEIVVGMLARIAAGAAPLDALRDAVLAWARVGAVAPPPPPAPHSSALAALLASPAHAALVATTTLPWLPESVRAAGDPAPVAVVAATDPPHPRAALALAALHAAYELLKLSVLTWRLLPPAAAALAPLAAGLGAGAHGEAYIRDVGARAAVVGPRPPLPPLPIPPPADLHAALAAALAGDEARFRALAPDARVAAAVSPAAAAPVLQAYAALAPAAAALAASSGRASSATAADARRVLEAAGGGVALALALGGAAAPLRLDALAPSIARPLRAALRAPRAAPPPGWPDAAYALVGRDDVAATAAAARAAGGGGAAAAPPSPPRSRPPPARTPAPPKGGQCLSRMSGVGAGLLATPAVERAGPDAALAPAAVAASTTAPLAHLDPPSARRLAPLEADADGASDSDSDSSPFARVLDAAGRLRFGRDARLAAVARALDSSTPAPIVAPDPGADADGGARALQEKLTAHAVRTLAAPLGRGALALGSRPPPPGAPLALPPLVLAGALEGGRGPAVALDVASVPPAPGGGAANELTAWAEFHNGAAAGLALTAPQDAGAAAAGDRAWLAAARPAAPTYAHAGLLLGAGLRGRLACLSAADLVRALAPEHGPTSVGALLGVAASRVGTCHAATARALFLHVPTRHPAGYPDLELGAAVQAAALAGAGLLHLGSGHAATAAALLDEIGRRPTGTAPPPAPADAGGLAAARDQVGAEGEAYSLAAGLALGMVCLARGGGPGGGGPGMLARLAARMGRGGGGSGAAGDPPRPPPSADHLHLDALRDPDAPRAPASDADAGAPLLVLEGAVPNTVATTPGAAAALGLTYLRTNDPAAAAALAPPATGHALVRVRPDLVCCTTLARALVLWDSITPDPSWVANQVPPPAAAPLAELQAAQERAAADARAGRRTRPGPDLEAAALAHVAALAGAATALGVRFAGTACAAAARTLHSLTLDLMAAKARAPDACAGTPAVWGRLDRHDLEAAACSSALALAAVMAGTGDLATLRLLRGLRRRTTVAGAPGAVMHGSHVAVAMGLGLLFLGGGRYTLATTPAATACLVASLWPALPVSPPDQRQHLQPLRHLYALAAQPRRLEVVDAVTRLVTRAPVVVSLARGGVARVAAPGLLPERSSAVSLAVTDARFWPVRLAGAALDGVYASRTLFVRRATGAPEHGAAGGGGAARLAAALRDGPPGGAAAVGTTPVSLCARYGADPATAELAAVLEEAWGVGGEGGEGDGAPPPPAPLPAALAAALADAVVLDKTASLPAVAHTLCLVAALAARSAPSARALAGGASPAVAAAGLALDRVAAASPLTRSAALVRAAAVAARGARARPSTAEGASAASRSPLATPPDSSDSEASDGGGWDSGSDGGGGSPASPRADRALPLPGAPSPPASDDGRDAGPPPPPPGPDRWDPVLRAADADAAWRRAVGAAADAGGARAARDWLAAGGGGVPLTDAGAVLLAAAGVPAGAGAAVRFAAAAVAAGRARLPALADAAPGAGPDALRLLAECL